MTTQTSSTQMDVETQTNYELVNGVFSSDEAAEIIQALFLKKINFHKEKNFSQLIRFGKEDPATIQRIQELQEAHNQALQCIAEAKRSGKSLKVNSSLSIEFV